MFCHRPWFRLACVATVLLIAGLLLLTVPAAAQARPLGEEPPSFGAEPGGLINALWAWIADHLVPGDRITSVCEKEGWGMDPNGGRAGARESTPLTGDNLP